MLIQIIPVLLKFYERSPLTVDSLASPWATVLCVGIINLTQKLHSNQILPSTLHFNLTQRNCSNLTKTKPLSQPFFV